jgi:hypothetical protein
MIDIDKIEAAAKAIKGWNCNQAWLDTSEDEPAAVVGHISEEGDKYPLMVVDCAQYYADHFSLPVAKFYATANPAAVLEMVSMIRAKDDLLEAFRESERELMDQRDARDAVLKQALEALECIDSPLYVFEIVKVGAAIAEIKEVLKP